MTLHLLSYNNYYNRQIKKYDTIEEYDSHILISYENYNFIPNDGVTTEVIVNYNLFEVPNYVIVEDDNEIDSRWFILDHTRTRSGQYRLSLYRDTIADHYEEVINAPVFIEKATLKPSSPFIFNNEDMTFNEIKQSETLLKDYSECPWIIGYYAKNTPAENLSGTVDTNDLEAIYDEYITTSFDSWEYNATTTPIYGKLENVNYQIYANDFWSTTSITMRFGYLRYNKDGDLTGTVFDPTSFTTPLNFNWDAYDIGTALQPQFQANKNTLLENAKTYITDLKTDTFINDFLSYNGKVIKDPDGKYYSLSIAQGGTKKETINITAGSLFNLLSNIVSTNDTITGNPDGTSFRIEIERPIYNMVATELTGLETTWDMTDDKVITEDAPYNIFAIPYGKTRLVDPDGPIIAKSDEVIGMATANSIIRTMADYLYDIQLLPYCPISSLVKGKDYLGYTLVIANDAKDYSIINNPNAPTVLLGKVGYILNVPKSTFTRDLIFYPLDSPSSAIDKKVANQCDKWRLCSPNYNGYFDFSVVKNDGVEYFNVDCCYKPFQPYIHINPNFKNMYGSDFNDARGLICGGDFSLPQIKDRWQEYQINNKNYQEIFSRQIENMDILNNYQRIESLANIATGTFSAGATGYLAGNMMIPKAGGAIGGITGAGLSLAGGIADYNILINKQKEILDFTKDQFGYQLGNIKALPYTLTKVGSFNNNNKFFPFIEYYTCTDEEKEAFRNKLKYNGMTVMAIGNIRDYITNEETYIKCKLIRMEDIKEDFHIIQTIADELNKGVFI